MASARVGGHPDSRNPSGQVGTRPLPMSRRITADHIRRYSLCPCCLYLNLHGPREERAEAHAFLQHLRRFGIEHERAVLASLPHVPLPSGSIHFRWRVTVQLLRQGHGRIYQPVIVDRDLVGIPDLLERVEIPSALGPFSYRPVDIKISTSAKPEHADQLAFYAMLLEGVQGLVPTDGDVVLVDGGRKTVDLGEPMGRVRRVLPEVREVMAGRPERPTLSTECGMCQWQEHCLRTLTAARDVSLIDGVGSARKPALLEAGYADLSAVAQAQPERLCQLRGFGPRLAGRAVPQARVLLEGRPRVISRPRLPEAAIELYLDMECQQGTQIIYLTGVLERTAGQGERFIAFVAEKPENEADAWRKLLDYLRALPEDPVIYHYHSFEATHLRKLAERHGIDGEAQGRLFSKLVDLHRVLKNSVVLPVHSYGLKPVAKRMGFRWRETGADAAMSMLWFDLWLSTGDRTYLEASIRYNEDDCRATRVIRDWLLAGAPA
jgi:predicted RecB family nuclease